MKQVQTIFTETTGVGGVLVIEEIDEHYLDKIEIMDLAFYDAAGVYLQRPFIQFKWRRSKMQNSSGQSQFSLLADVNTTGTIIQQQYMCPVNVYKNTAAKRTDTGGIKPAFEFLDHDGTALQYDTCHIRFNCVYEPMVLYQETNTLKKFKNKQVEV